VPVGVAQARWRSLRLGRATLLDGRAAREFDLAQARRWPYFAFQRVKNRAWM